MDYTIVDRVDDIKKVSNLTFEFELNGEVIQKNITVFDWKDDSEIEKAINNTIINEQNR